MNVREQNRMSTQASRITTIGQGSGPVEKLYKPSSHVGKKAKRPRPERADTRLNVLWKWGSVEQEGTIKNISVGGCFITSDTTLSSGDAVHFQLAIPNLLYMDIIGMVVRSERGVGFALRFKKLSATEQVLLERAIKFLRLQATPETEAEG
jgi:hypothetical protein